MHSPQEFLLFYLTALVTVRCDTQIPPGSVQYHYSSSNSTGGRNGDLLGRVGQGGGYTIRRVIRNFTSSSGGINFPDLPQFPGGSQVYTRNYTSVNYPGQTTFTRRVITSGGAGQYPDSAQHHRTVYNYTGTSQMGGGVNPQYVVTRKTIIRKRIIRKKIIRNGKTEFVDQEEDDDSGADGGFDGFNMTGLYGGQGYGYGGGTNYTRVYNFTRGAYSPGNRTFWYSGQRAGAGGFGQQGWSYGRRYNFTGSGHPDWNDGGFNFTDWGQDGQGQKDLHSQQIITAYANHNRNEQDPHWPTTAPPFGVKSVPGKGVPEVPVKGALPTMPTSTSTTTSTTTTSTTTTTTTTAPTTTTREPFSEFSSEFNSVESVEGRGEVEGTGVIPESSEEVEMIDPTAIKPERPERTVKEDNDEEEGETAPMTAFQQATLIFLWAALAAFIGCTCLVCYYLLRKMDMLPSCCRPRVHDSSKHRKLSQEAERQRIIPPEYLRSYSEGSSVGDKGMNTLKTTGSSLTLLGIPMAKMPEQGSLLAAENNLLPADRVVAAYKRSMSCNVPVTDQQRQQQQPQSFAGGSAQNIVIDGSTNKSASVALIQVEKQIIPDLHCAKNTFDNQIQAAGSKSQAGLPPMASCESLNKSSTWIHNPDMNVQRNDGIGGDTCKTTEPPLGYKTVIQNSSPLGYAFIEALTKNLVPSDLASKAHGFAPSHSTYKSSTQCLTSTHSTYRVSTQDLTPSYSTYRVSTQDLTPSDSTYKTSVQVSSPSNLTYKSPFSAMQSDDANLCKSTLQILGSKSTLNDTTNSEAFKTTLQVSGPEYSTTVLRIPGTNESLDANTKGTSSSEYAATPKILTTVTKRIIKAEVPQADIPTDFKIMEDVDDYFKFIDED